MAKTTGPALSIGSKGAIAKTLVYSTWRGVKYVRQHVIPSNPQSAAQTQVRTLFAFLREVFKFGGSALLDPWNAFALGRPFTGMNKFVGENVRVMKVDTTLDNLIFSPGAKGGLAPNGITLTSPVAGEAHVVIAMPVLPSGWAAAGSAAIAIDQQDPHGIFNTNMFEGIGTGPAFDTINVTGLTTGQTYVVGVYLTQTKPDGSTAYSVSLSDTVVIS